MKKLEYVFKRLIDYNGPNSIESKLLKLIYITEQIKPRSPHHKYKLLKKPHKTKLIKNITRHLR